MKRIIFMCIMISCIACMSIPAAAAPLYQTENQTETVNESAANDQTVLLSNELTETNTLPGEETITKPENDTAPETADEPENSGTEPEDTGSESAETSGEEAVPIDTPEAPVPEAPQGEFSSKTMGFYWAPSKNASFYDVHWQNDRGYEDVLELENDDWTCQMGRCILFAELPSDGNYTWTVTAGNEGGTAESEEISFTIPSMIPAPDAYRPNTTLSNQRPLTFEWEDVGYNTTTFRIQVMDVNTDQICIDTRYNSDAMKHVNGVCFLETEEYLPSGSYVWRVQGANDSSVSDWSGWQTFDISCPECQAGTYLNSTSAAIFPNGITIEAHPRFVWRAVTGAESYQLEIKDSKGTIILDENVPSTNCQLELCGYVPELTLSNGESYTWTTTTYGWNNSYWGSANGAFSYVKPNIEIKQISFIVPENTVSLDPDNQQIIWTDPGKEAAAFRLGIRENGEDWLFVSDLSREEAWCDGLTCSIQFHTIPEGDNYEIVVIPYTEYNTPGNAASLTFNN